MRVSWLYRIASWRTLSIMVWNESIVMLRSRALIGRKSWHYRALATLIGQCCRCPPITLRLCRAAVSRTRLIMRLLAWSMGLCSVVFIVTSDGLRQKNISTSTPANGELFSLLCISRDGELSTGFHWNLTVTLHAVCCCYGMHASCRPR